MSKIKVALLKADSYKPELLKEKILKLLELIDFDIPVEKKITLVNPNLLSAKEPERAITTHPNVVRTVVDIFSNSTGKLYVGDSPGGADRGVMRVWRNTGLLDVLKDSNSELYSFEGNPVATVNFNGSEFHISDIREKTDFVIGLPKLKTHVLTLMTGALKNCFGFIPGFRKSIYHKQYPKPYQFSEMLANLYGATKPDLFIMDAILAMEGDGPSSGKPKMLNLMLASTDAVALDSVAATIIGFEPSKIDYLKIASELNLGIADLKEIEIVGDKLEECKVSDFVLPSNTKLKLIPDLLIKLIKPYVWAHPAIDHEKCEMCYECMNNCPMEALSEVDGKLVYDYSKCIDCMCCHELCPSEAVFIDKSWLVRKIIH